MQITLPYCFQKYARDFGSNQTEVLKFVGALLNKENKIKFDSIVNTNPNRVVIEYLPRTVDLDWPQALQYEITGVFV